MSKLNDRNPAEQDKVNKDLLEAIEKGELEGVKAALGVGADVNYKNKDDKGDIITPLILAVEKGNAAVIKLLLEAGADVNLSDQYKRTPLHWAAFLKNKDIVAELLKIKDINVNEANTDGMTALHIAAQEGNKDIVEILLKKEDIRVNATNIHGMTALHIAAQEGNKDIVEILLEKGAAIEATNNQKVTPLLLAIYWGHTDIVKMLLEKGAEVNARNDQGKTPLKLAQESGRAEIEKMLQEATNKQQSQTADQQRPQTVIDTQPPGAPNLQADESLDYNSNKEKISELADRHLARAVMQGNLKEVEQAIKEGADVNYKNKDDKGDIITPLILAVEKGNAAVIKLLLEAGADVNFAGEDKFTPLHFAAQGGRTDIVEMLLEKGAEVDAINGYEKSTPLHLAAWGGHTDIVKMLLEKGAEVNASHKDKLTPLHNAAMNGHLDVARLLLQNGANINAKTDLDYTPLQIAEISDKTEAADLLKLYADQQQDNTVDQQDQYSQKLNTQPPGAPNLQVDESLNYNSNIEKISELADRHLARAVMLKDLLGVKKAIKEGADVNTFDAYDKNSMLHYAVQNGDIDIAKALLENGAKVGAKNKEGQTPADLAGGSKNVKLKQLLDNPPKLFKDSKSSKRKKFISGVKAIGKTISGAVKAIGTTYVKNPHTPRSAYAPEGIMKDGSKKKSTTDKKQKYNPRAQ